MRAVATQFATTTNTLTDSHVRTISQTAVAVVVVVVIVVAAVVVVAVVVVCVRSE